MAVRNRDLRPINRGDAVARGRRRVRRQQIIRRRRRGTVMRHFFSLPGAIATLSVGMRPLAATARLIALACVPDGLAARLRGAAGVAVDLPSVATAADDHLRTTASAQEQTARYRPGLLAVADETWTSDSLGRILVLHSCPARCGARRRCRTCRSSSAPCLPTILAGSRRAAEASDAPFDLRARDAKTKLNPDPMP